MSLRGVLLLVAGALAGCVASERGAEPAAWVELFNGKDLTGWVGGTTFDPAAVTPELQAGWDREVPAHWRVEAGELVSDGAGPHLVTAADYGDFELELEWKLAPLGDSGIYLRGYPQVQLWDPANPREAGNGAARGSGGLWNNDVHARFPLERADRPPGQWNSMRVRLVGATVDVWLNGIEVVRATELDNYFRRGEPLSTRGPVHLQTHGSELRFRNVRIRSLDPQRR